jgi:hypothetical protein
MVYLLNAFSLSMIATLLRGVNNALRLEIHELDLPRVRKALAGGFVSAVGHADTAKVIGALLGTEVPCNRASVALAQGDLCIVAQYFGSRLPEGATALPEGAEIRWYMVGEAPPPRPPGGPPRERR